MKALSLGKLKKGRTDTFEYDLNSSRGSRTLAIVNLNTSLEYGLSPRYYVGGSGGGDGGSSVGGGGGGENTPSRKTSPNSHRHPNSSSNVATTNTNYQYHTNNNNSSIMNEVNNNSFNSITNTNTGEELIPSPIIESQHHNNNSYYSSGRTMRSVSIPTTPIIPLSATPLSDDDDDSYSDFMMVSTTPSRAQSVSSSVGGRQFTPKKTSNRKPLDIQPKEHIQLFSQKHNSTKAAVASKKRRNSSASSSTVDHVKTQQNNHPSTLNHHHHHHHHMDSSRSLISGGELRNGQPEFSPRINSARGYSRRVQSADPSKRSAAKRRPSTPTSCGGNISRNQSFKALPVHRPPSSASTSSSIVLASPHNHCATNTSFTTGSTTGQVGWKPNTSTTSLPTPRIGSANQSRRKSFSLNPSLKSQLEAIKSVPLFLSDDIDPSHKSVKDNVSPLFLNQVIESLFVKEDKLIERAKVYHEFKEGEERIDRLGGATTPSSRGRSSSLDFNRNSFYPNAYRGATLAAVRVEKENLTMDNPLYLRKSQASSASTRMDHFGVKAPISPRSVPSSRASIRR